MMDKLKRANGKPVSKSRTQLAAELGDPTSMEEHESRADDLRDKLAQHLTPGVTMGSYYYKATERRDWPQRDADLKGTTTVTAFIKQVCLRRCCRVHCGCG